MIIHNNYFNISNLIKFSSVISLKYVLSISLITLFFLDKIMNLYIYFYINLLVKVFILNPTSYFENILNFIIK
jgi:hypothetical protein